MPSIPSFVLKKLYLEGSLRNTADGCQLQLKNTLAPATITGVGTLTIDGAAQHPSIVTMMRGNERLQASDAGARHPLVFDINVTVTIQFRRITLAPGAHRVGIDVTTREAGRLKWEISDTVAD